jgi:hypothetical protein
MSKIVERYLARGFQVVKVFFKKKEKSLLETL